MYVCIYIYICVCVCVCVYIYIYVNISFQFSHSVMSDSLWPHGSWHTRLPCSLPMPRACSNSCPSSRWCHTTISSPIVCLSSCFQSFPASDLFQRVSSLHQAAKVLEFQLQHQSFQWVFRTDFLLDGLVGSPCSPRDSQELKVGVLQHHSSKASIFRCSAFFIVQLSHSYMTTGKTIALTRWTFAGNVMSLLFNMPA